MPSRRKISEEDLEKARLQAHKPAAGYPIRKPPKDPIVEEVDRTSKRQRKHPAQR